jgi:hypothetical protein
VRRGITRPAQADFTCEGFRTWRSARKVGETAPGRSRIFRDFTLARARAEPLGPNRKGRLCRSEAEASRQSRDRLRRHPQEGQHSAASWRDPGPSASGERLNRAITCCAMGLKPTDRDVSRLGSRKPGAAEPHAPLLIILGGVSLLSGLHICKSLRARRRSSPTVSSE